MPWLTPSDQSGSSLIEILIAVGVLCAAAVTLAALFISSTTLMIAARHRSYSTVLARAKIEELLAAARAGDALADGTDTVDGDGRLTAVDAGIYERQWRLVPLDSHADRLLVLTVTVVPRLPAVLHVGRLELVTALERP